MTHRKAIITLLAALCATSSTATAQTDSAINRIYANDSLPNIPASGVLANPAFASIVYPQSLTRAEAGYTGSTGAAARFGYFNAESYLRQGAATIRGAAYYNNGIIADQGGCETTDRELVYPYFMADDIGGRLHGETYAFSGSYSHRSKVLDWGVAAGYRAKQQHRTRDPRPKNTSGILDISGGIALHTHSGYMPALNFSFRNYRQTNDITFESELGETPVYHTLGLGTVYRRFTGASKSAAYKGYRFGAGADIIKADRRGLFAYAGINCFKFDKILRDLNNLPLNHVSELAGTIHAGWENRMGNSSYAIIARGEISNRKGYENIFGEPTGNVYPQLTSLESYAGRRREISAGAFWQSKLCHNRLRMSAMAEGGYKRHRQSYLASTPVKTQLNSGTAIKALFSIAARPDSKWLTGLLARADIDRAYDDEAYSAEIYCHRMLPKIDAAAGISLGYRHADGSFGKTDQWKISLNITF